MKPFSFCTMSGGVFAGTTMPNQVAISKAGQTGLRSRREISQARDPAGGRSGQGSQRACVDMLDDGGGSDGQHLDAAREQIRHGWGYSAIRHMHQVNAGNFGKQISRQMIGCPRSARSIVKRARLRSGQVDEFPQRTRRQTRFDHQDLRRLRYRRNGDQVLESIERHVLINERIDDEIARGNEADRVTIRRRPGHEIKADVAAGARAILDGDGLAGVLLDLRRYLPGNQVGDSTCRKRHDHPDHAIWIRLRTRDGTEPCDEDNRHRRNHASNRAARSRHLYSSSCAPE